MKKILIVLFLLASPALAQQTQPPAEQAMGAKIIQEVQLGLQCNAEMITVKAELTKVKARLKELDSKEPEPQKEEK